MECMKCHQPLYIILPYFNFCGFKRRRQLFLEFIHRYKNLKIVVVEAIGSAPLGRIDVWKHIKLKTDSKIWLKENLINIGVKALPQNWKYMAWIDADIQFLNENWVHETIDKLQTENVVQLWQTAMNLGLHGETIKIDKSFAYMFMGSGTKWMPSDKYGFWHPGYAWACTHEAYETMGGLIDWAILGSGDRHMAMCVAGLGEQSAPGNIHTNYKTLLKIYENKVRNFKISWINGTIVHYWHGSFADRRYKERWDILTKNGFDPFEDIGYTNDGLVQLTESGARFEKFLDDYFTGRREDS